jgi:membrane associated rhomboid family serine protease
VLHIRRTDDVIEELTYEQFEELVRAGRIPPTTEVRFEPVTGDAFVPAVELELYCSLVDDSRTRFQRRFDLRRIPRVTVISAILLALVFVWQTQQSPVLNGAALVRQGAKSMPYQVELGEWWRLLSGSLLHSGWLHLVPNLAFLFYVGWNVETILGTTGMALLLVAAGIGSMALSSVAGDAATVGASGMTFAVFGAAIALGWRYGAWLPHRFRARYGWPMVPFVVYFLVVGMMWPTVDNFCHVGGLLVGGGMGLTLPSALEEAEGDWPRKGLRLAVAGLLALVVAVAMPIGWQLGLLPAGAPRSEAVFAGEAGYSLRPPAGWEPLGRSGRGPGWRSDTGQAQLTARAWIEELDVPSPEAVRQRWVDELEESASVVPRTGPEPVTIGLAPGWFTLESDVVAGDQVLRSLRVGVIRGLYVTTLEFLHPVDRYEDYERLRRLVFETVRVEEPRAVVRALEALHSGALGDPTEVARAMDAVPARVAGSPAESLRLAAELARHGERDRARRVLEALRAAGADEPELGYWELWIDHHLHDGAIRDAVARSRELTARQPGSLPAAALGFDVLLAAGERDDAQRVLERMAERWPDRLPTLKRQARLPPSRER